MKSTVFKMLMIVFVVLSMIVIYQWVSLIHILDKNKQLENKVKQQQSKIDSLDSEIFVMEIESNRQDMTSDYIFKKYPKIKKEYDEYYTNETE